MLGRKGQPAVSHTCLGNPVFVFIGNQFDAQESGLSSINKVNLIDMNGLPGVFMSVTENTLYLDFSHGYESYTTMGIKMDIVYLV